MIVPAIILLVISTSNAKPFSVTQMDNSPGIYFEYMGTYTFPDDKWTAITSIDLEPLISIEELISSEINQCKKDCPPPLTCRIDLGRLEYIHYLINTTRNLRNEVLETIEEETYAESPVTPIISYNKLVTKINEAKKARSNALYSAASIHHKTMGTWVSQTEAMLNTHESIYNQIFDIIQDIKRGTLSTRIFSPTSIAGLIDFINIQKPASMKPALSTFYNNQHKFTNLQIFRCRYTIKIRMTFLLFSNAPFELYRLHSVPIIEHEETLTVTPRTEFLAINESTEHHIYLKNLNNCTSDDNTTYCPTPTTILTTPTCEAEIKIRPSSTTFYNCQTSRVKTIEPIFIYLETAREWIYSLPSEQPLKIVCPSGTYETRVHGLGILGMKESCTANMTTALLIQSKQNQPGIVRHYIPTEKLNIISDGHSETIELIQQSIRQQRYIIYFLVIIVIGGLTILVTSMLCTSSKINDLKGRYKQLKKDTRRRPTITHFNVDLDHLPPPPPPLPNILPQLSSFPPDLRHNAT